MFLIFCVLIIEFNYQIFKKLIEKNKMRHIICIFMMIINFILINVFICFMNHKKKKTCNIFLFVYSISFIINQIFFSILYLNIFSLILFGGICYNLLITSILLYFKKIRNYFKLLIFIFCLNFIVTFLILFLCTDIDWMIMLVFSFLTLLTSSFFLLDLESISFSKNNKINIMNFSFVLLETHFDYQYFFVLKLLSCGF